jgi:putative transposase
VLITDKLKSYNAAQQELMPSVGHRQDKGQNNRAKNAHPPTRLREWVMRRFKSAGQAPRFLSAFGIITAHFRVGRHRYRASGYGEVMQARCAIWAEVIDSFGNSMKGAG